MKRLLHMLAGLMVFAFLAPAGWAAEATAPAAATTPVAVEAQQVANNTAVAGAVGAGALGRREVHAPGFLEHLVDAILELFDVRSSDNTLTHYVIAGVLVVAGLLLRRSVTRVIFRQLQRLAAKTETTLDDKMFPALEAPVATFVMLVGIFAGLSVLKLNADSDQYIATASTFAFSLTVFWGVWRAFGALLDHGHEIAVKRNLGIAAFMPWIKKTLMVIFAIIGVLTVIQNLGYGENIKPLLASLGIGGLAFALAAQDTLANVFGSIVVAIDQPFKIGEAVQIGANSGSVEDIGLRSTKVRRADKSLVIIPNKTVAAEAIVNQSRFTRRRVEQVLGLTYDTTAEQMDAVVNEIKRIVTGDPEVDPKSVMVFFRDFSASSLDIWLVYETPNPDFQKHMAVKQRLNLAIMRAVEARGLAFAFPSQTLYFANEDGAERLGGKKAQPPPKT